MRNFNDLLQAQWEKKHFVCLGLDPEFAKLPRCIQESHHSPASAQLAFCKSIIDATHDVVCAYKPNSAFYEAYGSSGLETLKEIIAYIQQIAPQVPVILDAKRGDIGNTNMGYVTEAFDHLQADAITVHPYLGGEALQPFLDRKDKGIIILCRTSNPGSGEFQNLVLDGKPLYHLVAEHVAQKWNKNGNCSVVAGATYPEELSVIRQIIGHDMPILIPGIGAQGGDLEKTVAASKNLYNSGIMISASRSLIFASADTDFADAARNETIQLNNAILDVLLKPI